MKPRSFLILAIVAFLAVVAPSTSTADELVDHPSCGTVVDSSFDCELWQECWPGLWSERLYAALDAPDDVGPNLAWQGLEHKASFGEQRVLIYYYRSRARRQPDNAAAQYLAARAENPASRIAHFHERAFQADPDFAPAHLGLVHSYLLLESGKEEREKKYPIELHMGRYAELCPTRVADILSFTDYGSAEFWEEALPDARERIMRYELPRDLGRFAFALNSLHALELRLHGTGAPEADVQLVRSLLVDNPDELALYDVLANALKSWGKEGEQESKRVEDEIMKRFPRDSNAYNSGVGLRFRRWHEEHGGFQRALQRPLPEAEQYYGEVQDIMSDCGKPEKLGEIVHFSLLDAYRRLMPQMGTAELMKARELYEFWWSRVQPSFNLVVSDGHSPLYHFAREFLARDVEADWALEVARQENEWIREYRAAPWWEVERPGYAEDLHVYYLVQDIEADSLLAEALLASGEVEKAGQVLAQAAQAARELAESDSKIHETRMTAARAYYWLVMGRVAEARGLPEESLRFYRRSVELQPPMDHHLHDQRAAERMAALGAEIPPALEAPTRSSEAVTVWAELDPVEVPDFTLRNLQGAERTPGDLGDVVLLHLWSVSCSFCRAEHPHLQKLAEEGYDVVALSADNNPAVAASYIHENGYTFPVLLSAGPLGDRIAGRLNRGAASVPRQWLAVRGADGRHRIVAEQAGFPTDEAENWIVRARAVLDRYAEPK